MIQQKAEGLFRASGLNDPEVSILLAGDDRVAELNEQWRGEAESTDVLSFPLHPPDAQFDSVEMLGDIVINIEYAERLLDDPDHAERVADLLELSVDELEWGLDEEIRFLLIHGLLHLLGYDHATEEGQQEMKSRERDLWIASRTDPS
jgi:probable rRNA maturation factor